MTRVDRWETYIYTLSSTYWKPTIWSEAPDVKQFGPNMCEVRGLTQRPGHRGQGSDLRVSLSSQRIDHLHVVVSVRIPCRVEEARSALLLRIDEATQTKLLSRIDLLFD